MGNLPGEIFEYIFVSSILKGEPLWSWVCYVRNVWWWWGWRRHMGIDIEAGRKGWIQMNDHKKWRKIYEGILGLHYQYIFVSHIIIDNVWTRVGGREFVDRSGSFWDINQEKLHGNTHTHKTFCSKNNASSTLCLHTINTSMSWRASLACCQKSNVWGIRRCRSGSSLLQLSGPQEYTLKLLSEQAGFWQLHAPQ